MRKLIECTGCGGLKRAESVRCPHCRSAGSSLLRGSLAAAGLGAMAACGGGPPCTPEPLGFCAPIVDAGQPPATVLYGAPPMVDGGFVGTEAYGIAAFPDAGPRDAGGDSGNGDE